MQTTIYFGPKRVHIREVPLQTRPLVSLAWLLSGYLQVVQLSFSSNKTIAHVSIAYIARWHVESE